jgi:mannose-6-phosphate isomerase-like protein (cupin superfamily)
MISRPPNRLVAIQTNRGEAIAMLTKEISPAGMQARTARYAEIAPQGPQFARSLDLPLSAYQKLSAEELRLLMAPPAQGGTFAGTPAIADDQGLTVAIVKCSPGEGPHLHAHYDTYENFMALDGPFDIIWGDAGEHRVRLDPYDVIAIPRGVVRTFVNAGTKTAHLIGFIYSGESDDFDDVAMTVAAGDDISATYGAETRAKLEETGWTFDAGVDRPTVQVAPDEMTARIARRADLVPLTASYAEASGIPVDAYRDVTVYSVSLVMAPATQGGPMSVAPAIAGPGGLSVLFVESPPGNGTLLHSHYYTNETFFCLDGRYRITWGDNGQHETEIGPWDMIAFPTGVMRAFENISDGPSHILTFITGESEEDFADIAMTPEEGERYAERHGVDVRDRIEDIGFSFKAGIPE